MKPGLLLTCTLLVGMSAGCRVDVTIEDLRDLDAGFIVNDGAPSDSDEAMPDGALAVDAGPVTDSGVDPD